MHRSRRQAVVDTRFLPVPEALAGERLDVALARMLGLSRNKVADLLDGQNVFVDGKIPTKSQRLQATNLLEVTLPAKDTALPQITDLEILYEDEDVVVVNKPIGVAAHTGPGWSGPTVLASLEAVGVPIADAGPPERKGIVSRLDVGTSGAMLVCKSVLGFSTMKRAFKEHRVTKIYQAVVAGHPDPLHGTIDAPIGRHPSREWRMAIIEGGKPALTHYDVVEMFPGASLLEIHLETGRTHQIRVHMEAIGHPCVGDTFYGADPKQAETLGLTRQWLHASKLEFSQPHTEEKISVTAPLPADLEVALEKLRS